MEDEIEDEMTIEEAIDLYQTALSRQLIAEEAAECLREEPWTGTTKKFIRAIQVACVLSIKTNLARRQMIKVVDAVVL